MIDFGLRTIVFEPRLVEFGPDSNDSKPHLIGSGLRLIGSKSRAIGSGSDSTGFRLHAMGFELPSIGSDLGTMAATWGRRPRLGDGRLGLGTIGSESSSTGSGPRLTPRAQCGDPPPIRLFHRPALLFAPLRHCGIVPSCTRGPASVGGRAHRHFPLPHRVPKRWVSLGPFRGRVGNQSAFSVHVARNRET